MTGFGFLLLRSLGPILTKRHVLDPVSKSVRTEPYSNAKYFSAQEVTFSGLEDLHERLEALIADPKAAILRGALAPDATPDRMRRLLHPDLAEDGTKEPAAATIVPCSRDWGMWDVDFSPIPEHLDIVARPEEAFDFVIGLLPKELRDVDTLAVWSSSAGVKPKLAAHLFQLFAEPIPDADLARYAQGVNGAAERTVLDPAVFRPAQLHYVASPIFVGLPDPLAGRRIAFRPGARRLASLTIPPAPPASSSSSGGAEGDLDDRLRAVGGPAGFRAPIVSFIAAYVRTHGARGTDRGALAERITAHVREVDPGGRDEKTIARYAATKELHEIIDWVIRRDTAPKVRSAEVGPYEIQDGRFVFKKVSADRVETIVLTNFVAKIAEERTIDDGAERKHIFVIEGTLDDGSRLTPAEVPAASFAGMGWTAAAWGSRPLVVAGQSAKDRAREAIQRFSSETKRRTVFQHTGWRTLPDGSAGYLHARGALTAAGNRPDVDVRLEDLGGLASVSLPDPPAGEELRAAVRTSIDSLLLLAPLEITAPLLGAIYRAPLCDLVETPEGVLYVGKTGTFKSELAARGQQHFGSAFHAKALPASWIDTANSLERTAFGAKDVLLVIDDFAPSGTRDDQARQHSNVERVLRSVGNVTGRGRMRPDGTLRPRYRPRGIVLSTAEDLPKMQSVRARTLILEVEPGDVDVGKLTECQGHGATGTFALAMSGYLVWIASRLEELRRSARSRCDELRARAYSESKSAHRRTPEAVGHLAYGIEMLLRFAQETGALSAGEAEDVRGKTWEALLSAGEAQAASIADADPVARFERLLAAILAGGQAHVRDATTGGPPPIGAGDLGWDRDVPRGRCIGWTESTGSLLLEPEGTYALVQDVATRQGDPLSTTKGTLWKRLAEAGKLLTRDERYTTVRRQGLPGAAVRLRVLHLAWKLGPSGIDFEGQVGHVIQDEAGEVAA